MSRREDDDSDAPEEYTVEQGAQQDEELRKVQLESKARVIREGKEKRRKRAQRFTPRPAQPGEVVEDEVEAKEEEEEGRRQSNKNSGMLPKEIVNMIADKETKVFSSDSEEEDRKRKPKKKKSKKYGVETVILGRMNHGPDVKSSLEFLKRRKMQVPRSTAVLNNSDRALRLLSTSGLLNGAAFASEQGLALMENCND